MLERIRCYSVCVVLRIIYVISSKDCLMSPLQKKGYSKWLLSAKRECLPWELQNREIFLDVDSIIWNKSNQQFDCG